MPRLRLSLLNLFFLTAILALAIVIALFWREIGPLRVEVRQLRDETGKLTIDDPTKLAAIQYHRRDEDLWRWRVWIPAGHSYRLKWIEAAIPRTDFPALADFTRTRSGPCEYVVSYRIDDEGWSTLDAFGETIRGKQQLELGPRFVGRRRDRRKHRNLRSGSADCAHPPARRLTFHCSPGEHGRSGRWLHDLARARQMNETWFVRCRGHYHNAPAAVR
jgi:hypothetical protein